MFTNLRKTQPLDEFVQNLLIATGSIVGQPLMKQEMNVLSKSLIDQNYLPAINRLGVFIAVPLAYEYARTWEGCAKGACYKLYSQMQPFGWNFLKSTCILLSRPQILGEVQYRYLWQVLSAKKWTAKEIQDEHLDKQNYVLHLTLHASTLAIDQMIGLYSFRIAPNSDEKWLLRQAANLATNLKNQDRFIAQEVSYFNDAMQKVMKLDSRGFNRGD